MRRNGKNQYAHRVSYTLYKGPIPEGLCVCHTCDERSCVNPEHLWLGTDADNVRDCKNKGRRVYLTGEAHGLSKLNDAQVQEIRSKIAAGQTQTQVAEEYGITQAYVSKIYRGKYRLNFVKNPQGV